MPVFRVVKRVYLIRLVLFFYLCYLIYHFTNTSCSYADTCAVLFNEEAEKETAKINKPGQWWGKLGERQRNTKCCYLISSLRAHSLSLSTVTTGAQHACELESEAWKSPAAWKCDFLWAHRGTAIPHPTNKSENTVRKNRTFSTN